MSVRDKTVSGMAASYLADANYHLAKLETEMKDLSWRFCWREDLGVSPVSARAHCRKLLHALGMMENVLAWQVTEQEKNIRAVK